MVPSRSFGDGGTISMSHDKPQDFYVVLTNVSGEPQVVWELWNSWGYQTISFELTTANGKKFVLSRGPEAFTKNNPTTFAVQLATERARVLTLRLTQTRPSSIPTVDLKVIPQRPLAAACASPDSNFC